MGMVRSQDGRDFSCSVERPSGQSYLFFQAFKMEITGIPTAEGEVYVRAFTVRSIPRLPGKLITLIDGKSISIINFVCNMCYDVHILFTGSRNDTT